MGTMQNGAAVESGEGTSGLSATTNARYFCMDWFYVLQNLN